MNTRDMSSQLGQDILVVMDSAPGFLVALRAAIASVPQPGNTIFTLFCCHPTQYWEHGGADNPEIQEQIEHAWQAEALEIDFAERCLGKARTLLEEWGVPAAHILTKTSVDDDSLVAMITHEVKRHPYSGIIVSHYHDDIVNRLLRKGITDVFRGLPKIQVLALDTEKETQA